METVENSCSCEAPTSCGKGTIARPHPQQPGNWQYIRPDCKKLTCEFCGPHRAAKYRKFILKRAIEHKLTRMMTLTLDPKKLPPNCETVSYIRNSWADFRVYLHREFKRPIKFIAILEFQKNGRAHLHILIDRYIYDGWIREQWQAVGGGKVIDIRLVDMHRISAYLSKYLTKELMLICPPKKRRITTCRAIRLFDPTVPGGWKFYHTSFAFFEGMCSDILLQSDSDAQGVCFFVVEFAPGDQGIPGFYDP